MTKIQDPESDPDPLVKGTDPRIRIRNTSSNHTQGRVKTISWQAGQDVLKGT